MTTRCGFYCRVSTSTKDQATENQLRELNSYCDRMGYEVVKVYEDEVSGSKTRGKSPALSSPPVMYHPVVEFPAPAASCLMTDAVGQYCTV